MQLFSVIDWYAYEYSVNKYESLVYHSWARFWGRCMLRFNPRVDACWGPTHCWRSLRWLCLNGYGIVMNRDLYLCDYYSDPSCCGCLTAADFAAVVCLLWGLLCFDVAGFTSTSWLLRWCCNLIWCFCCYWYYTTLLLEGDPTDADGLTVGTVYVWRSIYICSDLILCKFLISF